jgi:hypothetical protein
MNAARKLLLVLLVVMFFVQGCAGNLRCLDRPDAPASYASVDDAEGGLEQVRHRDVRAALWLVAGIVIVGAFIADLFILPYSCYTHHHYFPCCRAVVSWCH